MTAATYLLPNPPEPMLDRAQLARALGISLKSLDRRRRTGAIPPPSWSDGSINRWLLSDVLAHNRRTKFDLQLPAKISPGNRAPI